MIGGRYCSLILTQEKCLIDNEKNKIFISVFDIIFITILISFLGISYFSKILLKVSPYNILCSYEDEHGEVHEVQLQDLEARVFQHEMDHMEGTNFTQKVSKLKLKMAKKRASKVKKRADRLKKA